VSTMTNVTTRYLAGVGTLLAALLLTPASVPAQPPAPSETPLPTMIMKVCPKLEDAKSQADLSFQFGKLKAPASIEAEYVWKGCNVLPVTARLQSVETAITPFETWVVTYDPESSTTIDIKHAGATHTMPYAIRKQRVRYFVATFSVPPDADDDRIGPEDRGKWFSGWIEIPDDPYLTAYLRRKP
jgi:hypothetical protein